MALPQRYDKYRCPTCGQQAKFTRHKFLRAWRHAQGWTLKQIAERAGCSIAYLCDVELGKRRITLELLEAYELGANRTNRATSNRVTNGE